MHGWLIVALVLFGTTLCRAGDNGLVAHYGFDEGEGTVVRDLTGHGLDGTSIGARYVKTAGGYCLELDGSGSYVDLGSPAALDLSQAITLEAWIMPTGRPKGEPGIMGKQFSSFLLTYYHDGQIYWYVGSGGNHTNGPVCEGSWHLITATFDGRTMALYIDGQLHHRVASTFAAIPSGGRFLIGCVAGAESADDPNYRRTSHFGGLVDEVRIWDRALTEDEVATHMAGGAPRVDLVEPFTPIEPKVGLQQGPLSVALDEWGRMEVRNGGARVSIDSAFAYPGDEIGWNPLGLKGRAEPGWRPQVARSGDALTVRADAALYELNRRLTLQDGILMVEDAITSQSTEPVGVSARHWITSRNRFTDALSPGGAENPTIFLQTRRGGLGVVMEDNVSRLRFESAVGVAANQATFRLGNMALPPGRSVVLRWIIMPLPASDNYFDFANRLRQRWNTAFTVDGPFNWISMTDPLLEDPQRLKAWLGRKQCRIMALAEWLDYDPGPQDHVWPRDEYKRRAIRARDILKSVQPDIQVIGCIETDWVTIYPERMQGGEKLPVAGTGASGGLNAEQTRVIEDAGLPFVDSARRGPDGAMTLELYMRGGKPQTALWVYPAFDAATGESNYQYRFLMEQVEFLLDEVGLDGYYIDEFSQGWTGGIPTYDHWDGISAELDPHTGRVVRLYTDCSLAGVDARVSLARAAIRRGKVMVANTYATTMDEQSLPINRFSETWGSFDPMTCPDGHEPPVIGSLLRSNLASPIGLGILGQPQLHDTARRIMKAVVTYLRHGMLYYHYFIEDIPEEGPGSGEYGPINHMFPITIVGLHPGWIEGRERILTCVSGTYTWRHHAVPRVHVFDLDGRPVELKPGLREMGETWKVTLALQDWAQIAVIEEP